MCAFLKKYCLIIVATIFICGCGADNNANENNGDKGQETNNSETITNVVNKGDVCISSVESDLLLANETTTVTVTFDWCGSACFDAYTEGKCSASLEGGVVNISSQVKHIQSSSSTTSCIALCKVYNVQCEGPALAEGNYSILHGEDNTSISVPSDKKEGICSK